MTDQNLMRLSAYRWRREFGIARSDPFVFLASDHATRREREHVSLHHRSSVDVQATALLCVALVVAIVWGML